MEIASRSDVVVVGSGIAGAALGALLARAGIETMLLERERIFRDRVRGEYLAPWGVDVAMRAALLESLLAAAGSQIVTRYVPCDEVHSPQEAEDRAVDLAGLLPGVPGALDVGHPAACEALAGTAWAAGATVVRGVTAVRRRRRVYDLFQRDPELRLPAAAAMVGPHRISAAALDLEAVERLLA